MTAFVGASCRAPRSEQMTSAPTARSRTDRRTANLSQQADDDGGPFYRGVTPAAIASCVRGLTFDVRPLALKVGTEMRFCICARVEGSRVSLSGSVSVTTSARHYNLAVTARLTRYSLRLQQHLVSPPESDRCAKRMFSDSRLIHRLVATMGMVEGKLMKANKGHMAEDSDGDPVYMTRLQWDLDRVERDHPEVTLSATKEMLV